ncbi:SpvB/TcaC N-terminal domain-containing protein [uncultured Psychrosphaera sp.]|uniref:SpvB/TcaC N-terminal domain-containing protein n=1 Tax=uncultured Psychrosphaera sp. TaxID=1403522 RepID=UPI00262D4D38|nr:SpvB/TcaC N-terminal domain-containing protein [uncultured Psychrosphaera sp.]
MNILKIKHLAHSILVLTCVMFSNVSYAADYCNATISGTTDTNTRAESDFILGSSNKSVVFHDIVIDLSDYDDPTRDNHRVYFAGWEVSYLSLCSLDNVLIKEIEISATTASLNTLNLSASYLGITNPGSYKLHYTRRYSIEETWVEEEYGQNQRYFEDGWTQSSISTGIIHVFENSTPEFVTIPSFNTNINSGEFTTVTFTVYDSGDNLDINQDFILAKYENSSDLNDWNDTGDWSDWGAKEVISCSYKTEYLRKCEYRLTSGSSLGVHKFRLVAKNRINKYKANEFTITVIENDIAPTISTVENEDTIIAVGSQVILKATAEDKNVGTNKGIQSIKWCQFQGIDSTVCKSILEHDTSSIDKCVINNSQEANCEYTHKFTTSGVYNIYAEVQDNSTTVRSTPFTVTVDGKPSDVTVDITGDLKLGNTITITGSAIDEKLNTLTLCYGPPEIDTTDLDITDDEVCAGGVLIKECTNNLSCEAQLTLDPEIFNITRYGFYVIANDGYHVVASSSFQGAVYGSYTLTVPEVIAENNLPGTAVTISGEYNKVDDDSDIEVSKVELWINESLQDTIDSATSPFSFNFTLGDVDKYDFQFKITDDNGATASSASLTYSVEENPPTEAPILTFVDDNNTDTTSDISTTGAFNLSLTAVARASDYKWYEYSSCPTTATEANDSSNRTNISNTLASNTNITINKPFSDNGNYCYCAQATNLNGDGPIGLGIDTCAQVTVAISADNPGYTRFSANLSLTQSQNYDLMWESDSASALTFTLESKQGQPGSSYEWETIELSTDEQTQESATINIAEMPLGDVSYKITTCNSEDKCLEGQIITINHQVPYLHKAEFTEVTPSVESFITFEGLGLDGFGAEGSNKVYVQIRNTAQTFEYKSSDITEIDSTSFTLTANADIIDGIKNGGLRLSVTTLLGKATIEFNSTDTSTRADINLIDASPTISSQGIIYVSSGQSVYAFDTGGFNQPGWPFTLDNTISYGAEFIAAPTLDADDNNQDLIYIGATNRYVYKLDHQANIQWQTRLRGEIHAKAQLLSQEDTYSNEENPELLKLLYVGAFANNETSSNDVGGLYALNVDTGAERFMYPLLAGVTQEPTIFANGDLHVTTTDEQLHIINRQNLGPNALRWEDIDGSLISESLDQIIDWNIPENTDVPLRTLTGLFYGLLGRSPTQSELTFFAYFYWLGEVTNDECTKEECTKDELVANEITAAFLGSNKGVERFGLHPDNETIETATVFVDSLFSYLFPSEPDKDSAGGLTKTDWVAYLLTGKRSETAYKLIQTDDYNAYSSSAVDVVVNIFYDHCTASTEDSSCEDNIDSDNDGYTDAAEVDLGTNPLDPTDLIFDQPTLTASVPELGEFSLSWDTITSPNELQLMYYKVAESVNGQPDVILSNNTYDTEHDLVKAAGHYEYKVQACLNEQICSSWSNTTVVEIADSIAATTVQPRRAPQYAAEVVLPTADIIKASAEFGVTAGQFRVSESGAATYSIPFNLPAGIAGVKPEFGLAYSSQSGEGLAGMGWNLQGLSAITRCANSKLLDGYNKPVSYDITDHFCMDGQRLLLKSGTQGVSGSTYVTEIDSQQIISYSDNKFSVVGKDNSLKVYGATKNAKLLLDIDGESKIHSWFISYSQDNLRQSTNQIDYVYTEQDDLLEKVISEVTYSGNRVVFSYNKDSDRIKGSGYIQSNKLAQSATLNGVDIYNHNGSINQIKSYNFELEENDIGQQTLTSIQECAYASEENNRQKVCKKPVEFDYNDVFTQDQNDISFRNSLETKAGEYLRSVMVLDTNNDGVNELVTLTQMTNKIAQLCIDTVDESGLVDKSKNSCRDVSINQYLQQGIRLIPTDPDGDGLITFLVNTHYDEYDGKWVQFEVSGDAQLSGESELPIFGNAVMGVNIKPIDLNGDGYSDLVHIREEPGDPTAFYDPDRSYIFVKFWDNVEQHYSLSVEVAFTSTLQGILNPEIPADWQSIDMNQDGLSDIMMWGSGGKGLYFYTLEPEVTIIDTPECKSSYGYFLPDCRFLYIHNEKTINIEGKHAVPVDFNNDSLVDIVLYDKEAEIWRYYLNNGIDFLEGNDFKNNDNLSSSVAPMVVDVDADGKLELVFHDKTDSKWYRYEWAHSEVTQNNSTVKNGFVRIEQAMSDWTFSPPAGDQVDSDSIEYGMFADPDNDGLLDFLYKESRIKGNASTSINLYYGGNRAKHPGLLKTITTGTGLKTNIDYGSMANTGEEDDVYTPGTGLPLGMEDQNPVFRVLNIAGGGSLVKSVSNDVPVGNSQDSVSIDYHYQGARAQFGRGSLGFESISTTTEKEGVSFITTTTYSQVFPYLGMPLKTERMANDGSNSELISIAENRYTHQSTTLDSDYTSYLVYQQESRDCQANLNLDSNSPTSVYISSYSCQQMLTEQDAYANVTSTQTGHYNVGMYGAETFVNMTYSVTGELLKSSTSTNTYGTDAGEEETEKRFGRLSKTVVEHNKVGLPSQTRTSTFEYYPKDHQNAWMLKKETLEPEGDCTVKRVTEHSYDAYGNSTGTIVSNGTDCTDDEAVYSSSSKVYDGDGRYVKKTINNGITTSEDAGRNTLGQVISAKNTDGVQTSFRFDAFGTKYSSFNPSGTQSTKLNKACETDTNNCYTVVVKTANGIELAKEYVNTAGQVYKKSSLDAFGNWHDTYQTYDKYGRVTTSITQGTDGSEKVSHSTYDVFDRVITTFDVSTGLTAKKDIVGFVHTSTLNGDIPDDTQTNVTTYNALGEQKSVEDTLGNILTYTYGINGGLTSVHSSVDDTILSTIEYDKLGRKTKMIDKERGVWLYEYNALGQLVQQTDARGVITNLVYDDLGRKTKKVITGIDSGTDTGDVPSETMEWEYGTISNSNSDDEDKKVEKVDKHRLLKESIGTWSRHFYYDNLGRAVATLTNLDNTTDCAAHVTFNTIENDLRITDDSLSDPIASRCVIQQTFFDEYGRTFQQFDDYRRNKDGTYVDVRGVRQHYQNNQVVKQQEAREGNDGRVYHEIVSLNEFGLVTSYNKGAQRMSLDYDEANRLVSTQSSSEHIQADYYGYDSIGNVTDRLFKGMDTQEFSYDALNRVTHVDGIQLYHYDDNGSITEKDGWTLEYAGTGSSESTEASPLHGVTSRSKSGEATETYGYDANGNQIWGRKDAVDWRTFTYSGRNKATSITVGDKTTTFSYDANNKRFKRTDSEGTIFYVGSLELTIKDAVSAGVDEDGKEEFNKELYIKRYLGEAMQTYYVNGNSMLRWLYKDNLGSVIAIANDSGKLVKRFKYDVFGQQTEILPTQQERELYYELTFASVLGLAEISNNTRGYTGHEPVFFDNGGDDDKRIIHMNGRMYDASLGRMLQADPVVQAPNNLQNYNAYTYVLNNPLNMTDPSGYFFTAKSRRNIIKGLGKVFGNDFVYLAGSIASGYCLALAPACAAAWSYEYNRAMGVKPSDALRGAAIAGVVSYIGQGANSYWGQGSWQAVGTQAVIGGLASDAQGGNFGHGFWAAGLNSAVGGGDVSNNATLNVISSAVIGGTISEITGGKFANGALSAAFSSAMRQDWGSTRGQFNNNIDIEAGYQASVDAHGSQEASFKLSDDLSVDYSVSGSTGFADDVASHISGLSKTDTGLEILIGLAESGTGLAIFENAGQSAATARKGYHFSWDKTIIALDPRAVRAPAGLFQTVAGKAARPYISAQHSLGHELVHAWQNTSWSNGAPQISHNISGSSPWETQASAYMNLIRQQQGYRYRRVKYD